MGGVVEAERAVWAVWWAGTLLSSLLHNISFILSVITSMSIVILWYISCHIERSHDGPAISKRTSPTSSLTPASKAAASSELRSM